jgi:hypothetical protein
MIKKYEFNGLSIDKWIHQNNAVVIDFLDGCLLDNMLLQTRRGVAFVKETIVNTWCSTYTLYFAANKDAGAADTVYNMWNEFADAVGLSA